MTWRCTSERWWVLEIGDLVADVRLESGRTWLAWRWRGKALRIECGAEG